MEEINKEYLYVNGLPWCIINGDHRQVLYILKNDILPFIKNAYRVLLVDELQDKFYHYEVINGDLRRINSVCLQHFDREHHIFCRDMF